MIRMQGLRGMWTVLLLAMIAAFTCSPAQAKARRAVSPAMHYKVSFKGYDFAEYNVPNSERIIRGISIARNDIVGLGRAAFPLALRSGTEPLLVRVFVAVNLAEDDSLSSCRVSSATRLADYSGTRFDVTPAFEKSVCMLVTSRLAFRHGLYDDGRRFGGPINMTLEFLRWSGTSEPNFMGPTVAIAPPPIWVPNKLPGPALTFSEPEWEKFIPRLALMPKPLAVGVRVMVATDGTIGRCYAAGYSTVSAFDSGVCEALRNQARTAPIAKDLWDYPILVRWDGTSMQIVAPQQSQPATLTDGPLAPPENTAQLHLPANAKVEAKVTIAKNGKVSWCRIVGGAHDDTLDVKTCALLMRPGFFRPGIDIFGEPSLWRLALVVDWRTGGIEIRQAY